MFAYYLTLFTLPIVLIVYCVYTNTTIINILLCW